MILFAAGFLACLLLSGVVVWLLLRRGRARREQRMERLREQQAHDRRLRRASEVMSERVGYHRGFGDGVQWLFDRLVDAGEIEREGPAERAIRESRELYEGDG